MPAPARCSGRPAIRPRSRCTARRSSHGPGPKSTPALANGKLYSIGMTGVVTAFDAATGKQLWQKPGSRVVPIVYEPRLLAAGRPRAGHLPRRRPRRRRADRVRREHGRREVAWAGDGPGTARRSSPTLGGTRQIVTITQAKLVGVDAATGALLWERPFVSGNTTNAITPVLLRTDAHRVGERRTDPRAFSVSRRTTSG